MKEVLDFYKPKIESSKILQTLQLTANEYFIVSIHREENVDNADRLSQLLSSLNTLAEKYGFPVIVSTHPRTKNRLEDLKIEINPAVQFLKPFGFHDYNNLQINSFCAVSDSGTIAEESSILQFAAITPRDSIERPEAVDTGAILFTGLDSDTIVNGVEAAVGFCKEWKDRNEDWPLPDDYNISNTSERVTKLILGSAKLSNSWDGIRNPKKA